MTTLPDIHDAVVRPTTWAIRMAGRASLDILVIYFNYDGILEGIGRTVFRDSALKKEVVF